MCDTQHFKLYLFGGLRWNNIFLKGAIIVTRKVSLRKTCLLSLQGTEYNPGILSLMLLKYTLICQHIWFYAGHLMDFLNSKGSYSLTLFVDSIFTDWPTHQNLFVTSKSILGHLCVYLWTCTQRKKVSLLKVLS